MKCFFCGEEIANNTPVCPWCGRRQQEAPENKLSQNSASSNETFTTNYYVNGEQALSEETGWRCKNCGNFNVRTTTCIKCGKEKTFVSVQNPPADALASKKSKADELYEKGWKNFWDGFTESDSGKRTGYYSKAHGYLTMAYKEAGNDIKERKGIAGLMALVLTRMNDCKNAEPWAKAELSINPTNVFARLALYDVEVDKFVGHKGFIAKGDGTGFGTVASILTVGVDIARVQSKKNAIKTAALEAAKAIENNAKSGSDPNPGEWIIHSLMLLSIIENMWTNNMKEPYLCNVLLNLPWKRFTKEQIEDLQEAIEEIQVDAHGFLGRLK